MAVFSRPLLLALLLSAPLAASAQPLSTFERLIEVLNAGDRVRVTEWSGRVVDGVVVALTPDDMAVRLGAGVSERVGRAAVREISLRRHDGLQNGAAIGFATAAILTCLPAGAEDAAGQCRVGAVLLGGVGAVAGVLVDAAISRRVVVFRAAERPVAPGIGTAPDVSGQPMRVRWTEPPPRAAATAAWTEAAGRQAAPVAARPDRRWTVSVVTGLPSRRPLDDLEATMRKTGFDLESGGCVFGLCFGLSPTPYSIRARPFRDSWTAGANRRLGPRLGVSVTGGRTLMGWTTGRHRGTGAYVEFEAATTHVAPLLTVSPAAGLRVGAGPALFSTSFARTGLSPQSLATTHRPGLLAEASLTVPRRTRVFVELSAQERWLGRQPLGPVDVVPDAGVVFPEARVRMAHWFVGLGVGVRF